MANEPMDRKLIKKEPDMELNLEHERLKYIFTNMDDAVCVIRRNGELTYYNPAADRLFGLKNLEGGKMWENIPLIPENDALIQLFIDGTMNRKDSFRSLVDYVNRDGEKFRLHVSLTREDEESGMYLIVVSDLTQLMKVHSAFERYTSPDIADYVLRTPGGEEQGGTDREVSVLLSDLRGFTMISTRLSSAELVTMLNHYFESMSAVIDSFRGTVIEFLGDGIFVVFGAPKEMPGHAYTAVACAIEMQNAMEEVNAWNRDRGFPELEMGIGINSGVTAVGNIGSRKRMKYGCMGETVNLAGRLESFTVGGQIFVSGNTEKRIPEGLAADGEYSCMPKGAREEIKYYDVTGVGEKYRLRGRGGETTWNDVRESGPLTFFEMDGKSVDMTRHEGRLTGISADEKYGVLEAGCILRPLQNLMIRIGGKDVYAKVLKAGEGSYRLCFTAKPESLRDLLAREARSPGGEESPQA